MKPAIHTLIVYILFTCFGSLVKLDALDERTITMGSEQRWQAAEHRSGVTELRAVRPWPVLALSSGSEFRTPLNQGLSHDPPGNNETPDLILSFDEKSPDLFADQGDRYSITVSAGAAGSLLSSAGPEWARHGEGAAFFSADAAPKPLGITELSRENTKGDQAGPLVIVPRDPEALFAPGRRVRDFSLEFWLYPLNMENGEQILHWNSSRPKIQGGHYFQHIRCSVVQNRLTWNFGGFFTSPGGEETRSASLNGSSTVVPKLWSHHLIRFDADSGLLEYLVNGSAESIVYLTDTGTEGGEVYSPVIGQGGEFILGKGYTGLLDEFRIHRRYAGKTGREFGLEGNIQKYPPAGGRVETRAFDLGAESGAVLRLEALGGRIRLGGNSTNNNYYAGQGSLSFTDNSVIQFFIRTGDNPYRWTEADWQAVEAGIELSPVLRGRYVQIAANLYPSADGETSPYLEELRIVYRPNEIPRPPSRLSVLVRDGGVELSWRNPLGDRPDGYLVYYGTARGEYFGTGILQGPSPINAGKRTTLHLGGLDNGVLYYFAVASYRIIGGSGKANELLIGEFSQEVTARPLLAYNIRRNE
jgi:hypothetical protein